MEKQELSFVIMVYDRESIIFPYKNGSLGASKKPTKEFYELLKKQYKDVESYSFDIIPENVLSFRTDMKDIMWYLKPQIKPFYFSEGLPYKNGPRKIPYTIFHLKGNTLLVYCTKQKPKKGVKLYAAPYLNTDIDDVCIGNAMDDAKETTDYHEIMKQIEDAFFNSKFSHTVADYIPIQKGCNLIHYYAQDKLDTDALIDLNKRL